MGLEIDREEFSEADYARFEGRLSTSIRVIRALLERPGFGEGPMTLGAELEASLVDDDGRPAPLNHAVLAESVDPRLTFELDRFNLESNLRYDQLAGRPFRFLAAEMDDALAEMRRAAALHQLDVALIGILPTLTEADLQAEAMTDSMRYRALSASLRRLRREPFQLDIRGEDHLQLRCHDVTYEGAATSLQIHLRVAPSAFASLYNRYKGPIYSFTFQNAYIFCSVKLLNISIVIVDFSGFHIFIFQFIEINGQSINRMFEI